MASVVSILIAAIVSAGICAMYTCGVVQPTIASSNYGVYFHKEARIVQRRNSDTYKHIFRLAVPNITYTAITYYTCDTVAFSFSTCMELNNRIRALNKYAENEHATALAQLRFVDTFVLPHAADTTIRRRRDVPQSSAIFYRANDDYTTTTTAAHTKRHRVKRGWFTGIIRRVQQGYADLLHKLGLDQRDAMIEQLQNARDLVSLNTRAVMRYNNRLHSVQSLTEHEMDRVVHSTTRSDNTLT